MDDLLSRPQLKLLPYSAGRFYQATLAPHLINIKSNYDFAMLSQAGKIKYFVLYPTFILSLLIVLYGRDLIVAYRATL